MKRCRLGRDLHIFARLIPLDDVGLVTAPTAESPLEEQEAWLPRETRCQCGLTTWGEKNDALRETEMLERMVR